MNTPLVTIICLCYNQEKFVQESLKSIINQSYKEIEIIVIDDFSTDNSASEINHFLKNNPSISFIQNKYNLGNCKAFNIGLKAAKGKYIIDFSCDDIALPNRVESQVAFFENQSQNTAIIYSNALYFYSETSKNHKHFGADTTWVSHSGSIYKEILAAFFIPTATMMFKTSTLIQLGGYDENLAYEDFDIWVRVARNFEIKYQNEITTNIRKSDNSMSKHLYRENNKQIHSTYLICKKAQLLNQNQEEINALIIRVKYELRMCFLYGLKREFKLFYTLLEELKGINLMYLGYKIMNDLGVNFKHIISIR